MHPDITIVLPARDEAGSIAGLLREIDQVMGALLHEIVVVDDGSTDGTAAIVTALSAELPQLRLIRHASPCGQSAAIRSGVLAARGRIIATLDADGQNPPQNLLPLLAPLLGRNCKPGLGLVQGERAHRRDRLSRRLASRFANKLRGWALRDGVRDSGCGLKAFPREVYLLLPYFDHIHRFMPAMVQREGFAVETVPVTHAERRAGRSKYGNLQRAVVGLFDLLGAAWLIRRRRLPQVIPETEPSPVGLPPSELAAAG